MADRAADLAYRLRRLREAGLPSERRLTQRQLATVLSGHRRITPSSISSWESLDNPVVLPEEWLRVYALLFGTGRGPGADGLALPDRESLSAEERDGVSQLQDELGVLRDAALGRPPEPLRWVGES
jgi:hypothetical protein